MDFSSNILFFKCTQGGAKGSLLTTLLKSSSKALYATVYIKRYIRAHTVWFFKSAVGLYMSDCTNMIMSHCGVLVVMTTVTTS